MNKLYLTTDFSAVRFDLRESISNNAKIENMLQEIKEHERKDHPAESKHYMKGLERNV